LKGEDILGSEGKRIEGKRGKARKKDRINRLEGGTCAGKIVEKILYSCVDSRLTSIRAGKKKKKECAHPQVGHQDEEKLSIKTVLLSEEMGEREKHLSKKCLQCRKPQVGGREIGVVLVNARGEIYRKILDRPGDCLIGKKGES